MTEVVGPAWDISVGEVLRRRKVHERFGGSRQSGIASAPRIQSVLLFTGESGKAYGYNFDGVQADSSFLYTGEGQDGDQTLTRGNRAILRPDVSLRLFESVGRALVRYLGEYYPDPTQPHVIEQAPDRNGEVRNVLVFKLWPMDVRSLTTVRSPVVELVPLEHQRQERFTTSPTTNPPEAERREASLVGRYREWLHGHGGKLVRHKIMLPDSVQPLYTDTFDEATGELIEAKGSAARHYVRLALGQLLDYARFVEHQSLAILVPSEPAADLFDLLARHSVSCVYETGRGQFSRRDAS